MNLFEVSAKIKLDSSEYESGINSASKKGSELMSKIAKVGAAAVATAGAAVVAVTKQAVAAYADYEQLVGGVETLFGAGGKSIEEYAASVGKSVSDVEQEYNALIDAQNAVMSNAQNAYKTAGLSANQYMETVTSFSASLMQSLGGDSALAAEYSDRAITDMADNANKMGTRMESIMLTYQSLSRGNFAMLDNLKLGYGGTKAELERLIADASKMTDVQKELGITVDESSMSFGNIINAISVVQKEIGITGTTAKEASTTIQGSVAAMRSAWQNLLVGMADNEADMETLMDNFVDNVITVGDNLVPRIETTLNGITTFITKSSDTLIPTVVDTLTDNLPDLLAAGFTLAKALVGALFDPDNVYKAVYSAVDLILTACEELGNAVSSPQGANAIEAFATAFIKAIWNAIRTHFKRNWDKFTDEVSEEYGIGALFDNIKGTTTADTVESVSEAQEKILGQLGEMTNNIANMTVVLSTGELVGGISTGIDTTLGRETVSSTRRDLGGR